MHLHDFRTGVQFRGSNSREFHLENREMKSARKIKVQ